MTSTTHLGCPFCAPREEAVLAESALSLAVRDRYPVAPGHTLVIPRRHVGSIFDLMPAEWQDLWDLVRQVRTIMMEESSGEWDANVGVNDGPAAGQTVDHAHVHIIPRTPGDVPDPRGGVRWVVPQRADYWSSPPEGEAT